MDSLIILAITFALLWVLLVLPRRRMQQAHQRMVGSLEVGDDVVTSAGIYGEITALEPDIVHVRVADGVVLRVARLAIGRRTATDDAPPGDEQADDARSGGAAGSAGHEHEAPHPATEVPPDGPERA